jgi:hypothetical protein
MKIMYTNIKIIITLLFFAPAMNAVATLIEHETPFFELLKSVECNKDANEIMTCNYIIKNGPHFSIKNVGGNDTEVNILHSDKNDKYYLVLHNECLVIMPGLSHPEKYGLEHGIYVSPKTGKAYRNKQGC